MNSNELPQNARIGRTALRVNDLSELTEFYRDIVGLSVLRQSDARTVLGAAGTPLLVLEGAEDALERHQSSTGLFHNAFRVPSREALGDALARIREHWQLGGASDHGVSEALYLTDPEGNGIEIYRDYPREGWPRSEDGRIQMGTYPLDLEAVEAAATGDSGLPPETDLGHVHLEVSSLETFDDFYVDTLGFAVQTEMPAALFVGAGGYHHHIGANTWNHRTGPVSGRGLSWFELLVPERAALEAIQDRLEASDVPFTETDGGLVVRDPDEIEVRIRVETDR
ncbi:VOC family protein [Halomicroarcula limicola]|uniref:VOC family protein n=1 Tax=Haloarcula limicola TaxID=1429915 RepID=A0A8J8C4S9_9EURY|nr:VOC family protein [Halomicroarcula limicola]MBV0925991.1 VOC family protein [Halomicroarcula limicola]